ncbi:MAG: TonB-dependent receptor [Saprospiraceae bacterium]|nr:TonB-dependent receptor [Saprospiraceae bacterium]
MRIILQIFFFLAVIPNSLSGQPDSGYPPITIQEESIKVGKLLKEISRQSGADFSYNSKVVDTKKTVSFFVREASLDETLQQLAQKLNVVYKIVEGQIILNYAENSPAEIPEEFFTLSGFLSDQSTGENLISAAVYVKGTNKGVYTNEFGYYALSLKKGKYKVVYSYVGYKQVEVEVDLKNDIQKIVALPLSSIELPQIVVELPTESILTKSAPNELNLTPDDLNSLPEFGGESGLVKGLQTLPGIKTHSDGSAFFYVRGGDRDQNLIIIDDAPIYNPSHLLGFYSMVIPDFTKQITVYKSDVPASMGDRLSSIISIRTKDGNLNKFEFSGALNPFINRFSIETPLIKQRSSLSVTYRHSNYQWLYKRADETANFGFSDFQLKWNLKINNNNRLFFTTIQGRDIFANGLQPVTDIRWGNGAATLRWNHLFGPKLFSNTTIYTGNYSYNLVIAPNYWKSELGMLSIKTDFTNYVGPKFTAKYGFELQGYFNTPGQTSLDSTITFLPNVSSDYSRKGVLYYQGDLDLGQKIKINLGLRMVNWSNLGPKTYYDYDDNYEVSDTLQAGSGVYNNYFNVDPRLSFQYQLDSSSTIKLSYGIYHQYLQLILNSVSPFTAFEVWLPAGPNILPQSATQWALDYSKYFAQPKLNLNASVYYKTSQNQIDYEAHATTYLNPYLEAELRFGDARSYGLELMLKKDFGRLNGWVAYTYSRVFRKTQDLNNNDWYRAFQDRPHDFSMVLNYQFARRFIGSAYWTSQSGSTFTSPVGFYTFNEQTVPVYGERNNDRLPTYHRLDLAFKFILNKKETARYQHSLTFSIYNALAHENVYTVKFNKLYSSQLFPRLPANVISDDILSASQIDLIRFFPSLTYKFKI